MNCKNCKNILTENSDYCSNCGAKVIRNRLTVKALFSHFSEQFLNYDNKFLQTFLHLFSKPEAVIGCYINGTRKKYVNVISYFAIAITLSGLQLYILNKFFPNIMDLSSFAAEGMEKFQQQNLDFVQEYQSLVMMLYVPVFALMSKLVFINIKKHNYTEHLVILMYMSAQLSIAGAIIMVVIATFFEFTLGEISIGLLPIYIIYGSYCFKRIYKLSLKGIILKMLFFLVILFIVFILVTIIVFVIMYFNGSLQEMIEAQRAARESSGG